VTCWKASFLQPNRFVTSGVLIDVTRIWRRNSGCAVTEGTSVRGQTASVCRICHADWEEEGPSHVLFRQDTADCSVHGTTTRPSRSTDFFWAYIKAVA
jgi:hypothetical protein